MACEVAYTLYRTPTKIARIRAAEYTSRPELFSDEALPVDVFISPEQLVTEYVERLIHYPGALQVLDFADGKVRLVAVRAHEGGLLVGSSCARCASTCATSRRASSRSIARAAASRPAAIPSIEEGDEVFFLAARDDIRRVMTEMRKEEQPLRRIVIAGGGNIGFRARKALEKTNQVKLIERDAEARAAHLRAPREHHRAERRCRG